MEGVDLSSQWLPRGSPNRSGDWEPNPARPGQSRPSNRWVCMRNVAGDKVLMVSPECTIKRISRWPFAILFRKPKSPSAGRKLGPRRMGPWPYCRRSVLSRASAIGRSACRMAYPHCNGDWPKGKPSMSVWTSIPCANLPPGSPGCSQQFGGGCCSRTACWRITAKIGNPRSRHRDLGPPGASPPCKRPPHMPMWQRQSRPRLPPWYPGAKRSNPPVVIYNTPQKWASSGTSS